VTNLNINIFGDHTGENKRLVSQTIILMTQPEPNQPQLQVRLRNQGSVLHQLYDLVLTTTKSREELEISWETLAREEEREIVLRQRRRV
jgi:hypothetical protein